MSRRAAPAPAGREWERPAQPQGCATGGHTRRRLFVGLGVCVDEFRCRARVEPAGSEEPNPTDSIVFVRRGVFSRTGRDGSVLADANQILFFNRGEPYRYAHPLPGGDDCTILALEAGSIRAALEALTPRYADPGHRSFRLGNAHSTPRAAQLHFELLALARDPGSSPPLSGDDLLAELIEESLRSLYDGGAARCDLDSSAGSARRRDLAEAAKLVLNQRLDAPPRLAELATTLSCSPFHLSRVFRAVTGLGLRHYLRRLRVRLAADALARGSGDLTALALDLGFCDHSHFTNAFRREWGMPPSRVRGTRPLSPEQGEAGRLSARALGRAPA